MAQAKTQGKGSAPGKSLGKRLGFLLLVAALSLGALVGGLAAAIGIDALTALFTGGKDAAVMEAPEPEKEEGYGKDKKVANTVAVMPFKEIIVNVTAVTATGRKTSRFLKLNLAVVYDESIEGASRVTERKLFMRDAFQDYLRQLTERDLQGTAGLVTLKSDLLRRARAISGSDAPREMLISDLVIQ